jgi:hypothetical protein
MKNLTVFDLRPVDGRKSFYGKAQIIRENGCVYLRSYQTIVCKIDESDRFVRLWWGYSATTMRHVNAFLACYALPGGGKAWWDNLPVNVPVNLYKVV